MSRPNLAYFICAQSGVTPLATGLPGVGKTATVQAFARATGRPCYTLIGSLRDPADVGGYPYPGEIAAIDDSGEKKVFMRLIPPQWAVDACDGRPWVIFLDELTCVAPATQAAMLRVIAEHVVGDLPLPAGTWILAACNPPGIAANGFEVEPPMANRLCHLEWKMDWEAWDEGMMSGLLFPDPTFPTLPATWRDGLVRVGGEIAAFRKRRPSAFEPAVDAAGHVTMDRATMSGAWPSPRSWTNAATCLAAAESVAADDLTVMELISGCVGHGAASEFFEWKRSLDLPDPEDVIREAIAARREKREMDYRHPNRPDKVIALLNSVSGAVLSKMTLERWEAGMEIIAEAAKLGPDVAGVCARPLVKGMPKGAKLPDKLVKGLFKSYQTAGLLGG